MRPLTALTLALVADVGVVQAVPQGFGFGIPFEWPQLPSIRCSTPSEQPQATATTTTWSVLDAPCTRTVTIRSTTTIKPPPVTRTRTITRYGSATTTSSTRPPNVGAAPPVASSSSTTSGIRTVTNKSLLTSLPGTVISMTTTTIVVKAVSTSVVPAPPGFRSAKGTIVDGVILSKKDEVDDDANADGDGDIVIQLLTQTTVTKTLTPVNFIRVSTSPASVVGTADEANPQTGPDTIATTIAVGANYTFPTPRILVTSTAITSDGTDTGDQPDPLSGTDMNMTAISYTIPTPVVLASNAGNDSDTQSETQLITTSLASSLSSPVVATTTVGGDSDTNTGTDTNITPFGTTFSTFRVIATPPSTVGSGTEDDPVTESEAGVTTIALGGAFTFPTPVIRVSATPATVHCNVIFFKGPCQKTTTKALRTKLLRAQTKVVTTTVFAPKVTKRALVTVTQTSTEVYTVYTSTTTSYAACNTDNLISKVNNQYIQRFGDQTDSFTTPAANAMACCIQAVTQTNINLFGYYNGVCELYPNDGRCKAPAGFIFASPQQDASSGIVAGNGYCGGILHAVSN